MKEVKDGTLGFGGVMWNSRNGEGNVSSGEATLREGIQVGLDEEFRHVGMGIV